MTHTKGLWEYNEEELSTGMSFDVYNENGKRITEAYVTQKEAHLIAAAPDLLDALEELRCLAVEGNLSNRELVADICEQARLAIAKARGQS